MLVVPVAHLQFWLTSLSVRSPGDKQLPSVSVGAAVMLRVVLTVHKHAVTVPVQATVFADFSSSLRRVLVLTGRYTLVRKFLAHL